MLTAPLLDAETPSDLVEPRRDGCLAPKRRQVPERREQRLLEHLARRLLVAAHAQAEAIDIGFVTAEQLLDSWTFALADGIQQLRVGPAHSPNILSISRSRHRLPNPFPAARLAQLMEYVWLIVALVV